MQYIAVLYLIFFVGCCVIHGIGLYLFITTMVDDIQNNYSAINDRVRLKKNRLHIFKPFYETIHFHSITKQLSSLFSFLSAPYNLFN